MYYYNNELPPQQGWVCPKCGRVNAPWMPTCGCVSSQTSGTPYLVETSSISRDSHEIAKDEPQDEQQTIRCPKCGRTDYIRDLEKDMGVKGSCFKYKCINCNTYIGDARLKQAEKPNNSTISKMEQVDEPQTERSE